MKHLLLILQITAISLLTAISRTRAEEPNDSLARWERFNDTVQYEEVLGCADAVRTASIADTGPVVGRLIRITRNKMQPLVSRGHALELACEIADDSGARLLVNTIQTLLPEAQRARAEGQKLGHGTTDLYCNTKLLQGFVRVGARRIIDVLDDQRELLSLLKSLHLARHVMSSAAMRECAKLIAECRVPEAQRQATILEIIQTKRPGGVPDAFVDILEPGMFPALRTMVRAETTPDKFNFLAADALSATGDQEIVGDLESLRAAFRAVNENHEKVLRRYLWRIEVQHPPTKLLEYIASGTLREVHHELRSWAVKRAMKLGIDRESIRAAILQHEQNASTPLERGELRYMKHLALELQILRETDLPNVVIGSR